jgi:PAS domain-containing protein
MKDALPVLYADGVIHLTNNGATELFGVTREELAGTPAAAILPRPGIPRMFAWFHDP